MLQKIDLNEIFKLGRKIRYFKDCESDYDSYPIKGESYIIANLERLKNNFEKFEDSKTVNEINNLIKELNKNYKKGDYLKIYDAREITQNARLWEDRIIHLLIKKIAIDVPSSHILNYDNLIKGTEGFFNEKEIKKLPKLTRLDFDDCCHCLLLGLATPSALMALRSLEEMLKRYYKKKTKKSPNGLEWGTMTEEIKKLPSYDADLITHLDNLRKNLRNKAMHPERRFERREMEELFVTVIKAIQDLSN